MVYQSENLNPVIGSSLWLVKIGFPFTGHDFFIHKMINRIVYQWSIKSLTELHYFALELNLRRDKNKHYYESLIDTVEPWLKSTLVRRPPCYYDHFLLLLFTFPEVASRSPVLSPFHPKVVFISRFDCIFTSHCRELVKLCFLHCAVGSLSYQAKILFHLVKGLGRAKRIITFLLHKHGA